MELAAWATSAVRNIRQELWGDAQWRSLLAPVSGVPRIHLAVFVEPFLSFVLGGAKSVESRFSTKQCAPFRRVAPGDIILLKEASGPVRGICAAAKTWFYNLRSVPLASVRERYAESICATEDEFWRARERAEYATLIKLQWVRELTPLSCPKRDRRGWVILHGDRDQLALPYSS
jgi:ASC-1-like (ASCH) protein